MIKQANKYVTYRVHHLPPGMFGEVFLIVTATSISVEKYIAEYFFLIQRPVESIYKSVINITDVYFPDESLCIDFSLDEIYRQAEVKFRLLMEGRAAELERPDIAYAVFEMAPCPRPFVGCWMQGRFREQIAAMQRFTQCPSLASHLKLLKAVKISQ